MSDVLLFNVGATWDLEQLEGINRFNKGFASTTRVSEVYGSFSGWGTARSQDRIPEWQPSAFGSYAERAQELGIDVKWTMNFSCPGKLDEFSWEKYRHLVKTLKRAGVHHYIVTVPLIIDLIKQEDPGAKVEISTINRVTSVKEINELAAMGASSLCWDVMQNRNFQLLSAGIEAASRRGMTVEVIVNEFCTFMCPHRNVCYNLSSHNSTRAYYHGYPFQDCIDLRNREPWQWVAARFILPSDVRVYQELGVSQFKITGRTHPTPEVLRVLGYYMAEQDPGNLLELWHHINVLVGDEVSPPSQLFISTRALWRQEFLEFFRKHGHRCALYECGRACTYCLDMFNEARKEAV